MDLILASGSPRRREILGCLGVSFTIRTADTDESSDVADPGARVEAIAAKKCAAVVELLAREAGGELPEDTMVLASDTLVSVDGVFLGKPTDEDDARRMVGMLAGRAHEVSSGIAIHYRGRTVTAHELTRVYFAPMSDEDIDRYVETGESFGKAGGYAIQGHAARYISRIEGDYFNVVGLPVRRLCETLEREFGVSI